MSRNLSRRPEFHDEHCCAGNVSGHFRRTSSLRVRGEKMVHRSPLTTRKFPIITENTLQKVRHDGDRLLEPARARSQSLSSNTINKTGRSYVRTHEHYMDSKSSATDTAHTPPGSPEDLPDDDSLNSYGSAATAASMDAGFAPFNGTTFSGRSMRYVLHCSSHAGLSGDEYLTPTQRAQKHIRRLKNLLNQAKRDIEKKDSEIFHLTKEVVELRLYKASICSPDDKSTSSEIVTIRENAEESSELQVSPKHEDRVCETAFDVTDGSLFKETPTQSRNSEMQGSFTDSGHFDDLTNSSLNSKESMQLHAHDTHDAACSADFSEQEIDKCKLIDFYEKKIEDLMRAHIGETQEIKEAHNDKVEVLLQKLSDVNSRYGELLPSYEQAKERIHALEKQLEDLQQQLQDEEARHRSVYLQMYNKGMEAAKLDTDKEAGDAAGAAGRVSVQDLLEQLQVTQTELDNVRAMYRRIVEAQRGRAGGADPATTLQFLKSAVYYLLTDPEHHAGHLAAVENILGFSDAERREIRKTHAL